MSSTERYDPAEWANAAAEVVRQLTDRWAIAGALAALTYRDEPRLTTDADLYVEWRDDLIPTLEGAGYTLRVVKDPQADNPHLLMAQRDHERVDFIIPTVDFQEQVIDRANAHVITAEDVIVLKLMAWRSRDRDDVASILAAGHDLDTDYIEHWAAEWEVLDRWREATS